MITPEQREARRNCLGSSDIASLFGLDPFRPAGPLDLYIEKTMETVPDYKAESEAIEIGNLVEVPLVEWAGKQVGSPVITDPDALEATCKDHPLFKSHIDGLLQYLPKAGVEGKSTSMADQWGKSGTDEVPDRVNIQCQVHMACHGLDVVYVPVLVGRFGLKRELYKVDRHDAIIKLIIEKGEAFWENHVLKRVPPEATVAPSLDTLKAIRRIPATWANPCDLSIIEEWEAQKKARLDAEKAEKAALAQILLALGDAEGMRLPDGRELTYFAQNGADAIDRDGLAAAYPEIYQQFTRKTSFRVARIRKGK